MINKCFRGPKHRAGLWILILLLWILYLSRKDFTENFTMGTRSKIPSKKQPSAFDEPPPITTLHEWHAPLMSLNLENFHRLHRELIKE